MLGVLFLVNVLNKCLGERATTADLRYGLPCDGTYNAVGGKSVFILELNNGVSCGIAEYAVYVAKRVKLGS